MNYREFTERVYNYKHGLTKSAESQNIEHSAKQTEEINENEQQNGEDHIAHSEKGGSWDQHKYIRKEYLGNGNWRYIYEDGSSNVTNAANEKEADVKEGAYQANKAYGNGAQNTNYQTGAARMMSSNTNFTQARKDMYKELGDKAADHNKQLSNFEGMAKGLAQSNADQEASKLKVQAGNIANNLGASQKETEDRKMYVDLANKARDYNSQLEGFQGVVKSLEQSNADQADSARQAEKEALADKAQARSDRYDKMANLDVNTSAAPYQQLQNQGAKSSQESVTANLAHDYTSEIDNLKDFASRAGMSEEEFNTLIDAYEIVYGGEKLYSAIKAIENTPNNIVWMEGANDALKIFNENVLPKIQENLAERLNAMGPGPTSVETNNEAKLNQFAQMTPNERWDWSQQHPEDTSLLESIGPLVDPKTYGGVPANPYAEYLASIGLDANNLSGAEFKRAFPSSYNPEVKDDAIYRLTSDGILVEIKK